MCRLRLRGLRLSPSCTWWSRTSGTGCLSSGTSWPRTADPAHQMALTSTTSCCTSSGPCPASTTTQWRTRTSSPPRVTGECYANAPTSGSGVVNETDKYTCAYLRCIPKGTDKAGALCAPVVQDLEASTTASPIPKKCLWIYKMIPALASLEEITWTWLPFPFQTRHKDATNWGDTSVIPELSEVTPIVSAEGVSTPETNWNSSRIEWTNCHTFQCQFIHSIGDKFQLVSDVDGPWSGER